MAAISTWSTSAGSNNSSPPDGFPENMSPSGVNNSAREVMAAVRTWYEDYEWRNWGHVVTRTGNTTFTIPSDVTSIYKTNRPIRCTDATTLYGIVASSSFSSPTTTVTVTLDSGNLSASLTAVALGFDGTGDPIHADAIRGGFTSLSVTSTDAGASFGPDFIIDRNSASPTAADAIGRIILRGRNSTGGVVDYASIYAQIVDATAASEDVDLYIRNMIAGVATDVGFFRRGLVLGSPSGGDLGTGTVNAQQLSEQNTRVFSNNSRFSSTNQTITTGGSLTLAHGLGSRPVLVQLLLVCVTAEQGYSVNDEVFISPGPEETTASARGISVWTNATNVNVRYGNTTSVFTLINATTGSPAAVTNANWRLRVVAWG